MHKNVQMQQIARNEAGVLSLSYVCRICGVKHVKIGWGCG